MKKAIVIMTILAIGLLAFPTVMKKVNATTTINYCPPSLTLTSPFQSTSWSDVWDLTLGDLTLNYTIDQTHVGIAGSWDNVWTEVGLRTQGASNYNPATFGTYQGCCGGWMASGVGDVTMNSQTNGTQSLHDKFDLQASGGRGEGDYDLLNPSGPVIGPFGSGNNYGIWFDRDMVDQYQAASPGMVNGGTYNTTGIYHVIIHYHAINSGLGSMFATVNGIPTGFYWDPDGPGPLPVDWSWPPHYYPAGISFKGDMTRMQVFAGIWAPSAAYGYTVIQSLTVTGEAGVSSPLVAGFTYSPSIVTQGTTVQFADTTHGGSTPYTWSWDLNGDGVTDSTAQNPTYVYTAPGDYNVKMNVKGFFACCESASITKTIHVYAVYLTVNVDPPGLVTIPGEGGYNVGDTPTLTAPAGPGSAVFLYWDVDGVSRGGGVNSITVTMDADHTATAHYYVPGVGGEWAPVNVVQLAAPYIVLAFLAAAALAAGSWRLVRKRW